MANTPPTPPPANNQPFGAHLEPVLHEACDGRLSEVRWFRTDWQRGGALTGYATFTDDDGQQQDVVVKMPVPPRERLWLRQVQDAADVAPKLYVDGEVLGGYDLAWVIMEHMRYGPLTAAWGGREFDLLAEVAGRFYAAAASIPVDRPVRTIDWKQVCDKARRHMQDQALPDTARWNIALKKAQKKLKSWLNIWESRPVDQWCHGDLHLGNAMTRAAAPGGPAVLIDYAQTHAGHWVEDAVYVEHLYWADKDSSSGRRFAKRVAEQRKIHGLPVDPDWAEYARVKRALTALSAPLRLDREGNLAHLHAALEVLESLV